MLKFFEEIENNFDVLFFIPHEESDSKIKIISKTYIDPGKPVGGSSMGQEWHIVLFKEGEEEQVDKFDAILSDPKEYISSLIPQNWYGLVAKKTTTSNIFVDDVIDNIKKSC